MEYYKIMQWAFVRTQFIPHEETDEPHNLRRFMLLIMEVGVEHKRNYATKMLSE